MVLQESDFERRNFDPLKNLSFYKARCLCCGRWIIETTEKDRQVVWMVCPCGHVLRAENRVRWH